MDWYLTVLKKYTELNGRARRKEYWMFCLINLLIYIGCAVIDTVIGSWGIVSMIYSLAVLVPSITVTVRRLHDTGRPGWWLAIVLVPLIGALVLLVFMVLDSEPEANDFGPNPKLA